ncbi:MAG: ferric reductase-like transmembrane domain-containing protein [Bacteroidetes bacterium]|nr:ferric reductase-like transmembrane domain-containing protein [Bacteroidota bacterium]
MGVTYQAIGWNRQKKMYDWTMLALIGLYLGCFITLNVLFRPEITPETLIIRAAGSLALVILHIILIIGPLARLDSRFLPLLYNRRHLGVTMFLFAAIHGIFSLIQFHALGSVNPIVSLFTSNTHYGQLANFPFQTLGFFALIILFLMAATSHDFWLNNLNPKVWKSLHMMVYLAYGLIIMHVMLGVVQAENSIWSPMLMGFGMMIIIGLHLAAGSREMRKTPNVSNERRSQYVEVCELSEFEDGKAKMILVGKENIAIFRYGNKLSAVSNICKHQNGPLGEGRIVNGCIVCPWHGYEYKPEDGTSPPPFKEKVSTYELRLEGNVVWVDSNPRPEGTYVEPLQF